MTNRERLMATLRGEPVDRPAVNFYEIGGFDVDKNDPDEFNVYNDPSWQELLELAEEKTDLIRMRSPVICPADESCRSEFFKTEIYMENGSRFTRTTLNICGRTMTALSRRDPDLDTIWELEHLLKNTDDIRAYLELPNEAISEQIDVGSLIEEDRKIDDRGIVMVDTADPLCCAASLLSMENFTIVALTEQKLFHSLIQKLASPLLYRTEETARAFPGHLWRIFGPEYAAEPYLPPHLFKEYVVGYTGPMVKIIQNYGGYARIHCHGRIRAILPYIIEMGADAVDPIEPPPQGDVDLAYIRREYGKSLVLFGNLEIADIENVEPPEFEKLVSSCLRDVTSSQGKGFVLMPSASPYGRKITARILTNYETIIRIATNSN